MCDRVICKLLASKSESIRVQALKVLGYFLKHLGHKSVPFCSTVLCLKQKKKKLQPDGGTFRDGLFSGKRRRAASAKFRSVCLWVFAKDNVLIIKSRRNNSSDNTHWQGGGTLWAAANAGGLIPPMWHSKPIAAWQRMALWRCTWALQLWSPLFSVQAKWTFVLKTWYICFYLFFKP